MTLVLRYSARSDRGLVRQNNQDAVYAGPRLLALADGMGGHAAGEVASSLVISALAPLDDDVPGDDLLAELRDATHEGNDAISRHVADAPDLEGMGTTLTAILFAGSRLGMVHVGDSRCYLLRGGEFAQITKDDTFVQSLIDEGRITEEESHTHPQRSLLLRAITGQDVDPSLSIREARAGDRFLLCSDGLSGPVSDETLHQTLEDYLDPRECADRMIELALRGGGPDNITCIVADVVDVAYADDAPIIGGSAGRSPRAGDGDYHRDERVPHTSAQRAAATTLPRTEPVRLEPARPEPAGRRRGLRSVLALLGVLVVLAAGVLVARALVLQQYYVGVAQEQVAIYQGVRGNVLGIPLQRVTERSDIGLDDLPQTVRTQLTGGIVSDDGEAGARGTLDRLREQMLPLCSTLNPPAPPVVAPPAVPGGPPVTTTPLPTVTPEPGRNCRLDG
ncbi:PP2C family protein-serine/threonine phosphatase [Pseudonocardia sp. HH130630-07]|uniref:PP2C family protein-serine/threonine phosphatase n=1 Tax=Pseudonocardia sp. HH130630-07 TaxID=1690815 RepID=UPI0008152BDC|nr:PP2C family serine/threonine-protein phosphatase [Pseudonocardia sp. HH130630-07]ANY06719.1 protein phosphatase [Pseudonocardia sp. HH130630-07]